MSSQIDDTEQQVCWRCKCRFFTKKKTKTEMCKLMLDGKGCISPIIGWKLLHEWSIRVCIYVCTACSNSFTHLEHDDDIYIYIYMYLYIFIGILMYIYINICIEKYGYSLFLIASLWFHLTSHFIFDAINMMMNMWTWT